MYRLIFGGAGRGLPVTSARSPELSTLIPRGRAGVAWPPAVLPRPRAGTFTKQC